MCDDRLRRPCLLLANEKGEYDTVVLYRSKKDTDPLAVSKYQGFSQIYLDEVVQADGSKMACTRYISFTHKDAERNTVSVYVSRALDVEDDSVWHPKSLHEEVIKNVGYWNFPSGLGGKVTYFTEHLMQPSWENYNTW